MQISQETLREIFISYAEEILARVKNQDDLFQIVDEFMEAVESEQLKGINKSINKTRTGNLKVKCPNCKQEHIVYIKKITETDKKVLEYLKRADSIDDEMSDNQLYYEDDEDPVSRVLEIAKMIQIQENEGLKMMLEENKQCQ